MNAVPTLEQPRARAWSIPCAIALGCVALAGRSASLVAMLPTVAVGVLGVAGTVGRQRVERHPRARVAIVTLLGVAGMVAVRAISPPVHIAYGAFAYEANIVAAIAEEAFFRRFVYGWIAQRSDNLAIAVSAVLFAMIHVPLYGVAILPIDFVAGLLLGWQRKESGTWLSPAITHVVANIVLMR